VGERSYLRPGERRRQLLDAASRLFDRGGFTAITVSAVAAEALRSVRREKLMGLLPRKVCFCCEMQTIRTSGQKVICDLAKLAYCSRTRSRQYRLSDEAAGARTVPIDAQATASRKPLQ